MMYAEFIICIMLGCFGGHKFYIGDTKTGIIYLLTFGYFGFGWMYDIAVLGIELLQYHKTPEEYMVRQQQRRNKLLEKKAAEREAVLEAERIEREKIERLESEGVAYCPRCKSTSLQYVERRKQLSLGRAVGGTLLLGPLGGAVGAVTSNKHKGLVKCLKCGHQSKL